MPVRKEVISLHSTYNLVVETNRSYVLSQNIVGRDFRTYDPSLSYYFLPSDTTSDANVTIATASASPMKLAGAGAVFNDPNTAAIGGCASQDMYLVGGFGNYSPYFTSLSGPTNGNTYVFLSSGTVCQVLPNGSLIRIRQGTSFTTGAYDHKRSYTYVFHETSDFFFVIEKMEYVLPSAGGTYQQGSPTFGVSRISKLDWSSTLLAVGQTQYSGIPVAVKETDAGILFYPASRGGYSTANATNVQNAFYYSKSNNTISLLNVSGILFDNAANFIDAVNPTVASSDTSNPGFDKFYLLRYTNSNTQYQLFKATIDSNITSTGGLDSSGNYSPITFTNVPNDLSITQILQSSQLTISAGNFSNKNRFLHYFKDESGSEYLLIFVHQIRDASISGSTNLPTGTELGLLFKINPENTSELQFKQRIKLDPNTVGVIPNKSTTSLLLTTPYSFKLLNWVIDAEEFNSSVTIFTNGKLNRAHYDIYGQIWIQYGNTVEVYHPSSSKYVKLVRQNPEEPLLYLNDPITTNMLLGTFDLSGARTSQEVSLKAVNCKFSGDTETLTVTTSDSSDLIIPITISSPGSISVIVTNY